MKRWFISLYLLLLTALVVAGGILLAGTWPWMSGAGLMLAAGAPLGFFGWLMLARPARTEPHPVGVSVAAGLGAALTMVAVYRFGDDFDAAVIGALAALTGWMIYLRWYSRLARPAALPDQGRPLPDFELEDSDGSPVHSTDLRGQPAVLLFYWGSWCPLCTAQIRELADQWRQLDRLGAVLYFISSQSRRHTRAIAGKFDIPARFLRDTDNRAARILGIEAKGAAPAGMELLGYPPDAALPAVIVTDAEGTVAHIEVADNYRLRPEPARYLKALQSTGS